MECARPACSTEFLEADPLRGFCLIPFPFHSTVVRQLEIRTALYVRRPSEATMF